MLCGDDFFRADHATSGSIVWELEYSDGTRGGSGDCAGMLCNFKKIIGVEKKGDKIADFL